MPMGLQICYIIYQGLCNCIGGCQPAMLARLALLEPGLAGLQLTSAVTRGILPVHSVFGWAWGSLPAARGCAQPQTALGMKDCLIVT